MGKSIDAIFWLRRDLRLNDNAGLYHALKESKSVLALFIFDNNILEDLSDRCDKRVYFIHKELQSIKNKLEAMGSSLLVKYGTPKDVFNALTAEYNINKVYTNKDYEPYAKERDGQISLLLKGKDIAFKTYKDQVIFEENEVLKGDGTPYVVYTPYANQWKEQLTEFYYRSYPTEKYYKNFCQVAPLPFLTLEEIGFKKPHITFPDKTVEQELIEKYQSTRNYPAKEKGTSQIGVHLRFGTVSIRQMVQKAIKKEQTWLNELIWREFFMMILWHYPHVTHQSFRKKYDKIKWCNNEEAFQKWCNGKTGIPIVDAGMRELNATGMMHNRVRMIVASFLCKNLLIDWRWGEAYFAEKLLDYDLAANNGNWQWAAGTGCDAAPYFRVFNPITQAEKFDPDKKYIKKWVPELNSPSYPDAMVDLKATRERAIHAYSSVN